MQVFFDERQNIIGNESFSPSAGKPAQVVKSWRRLGILFKECSFTPLSAAEIALAHNRGYVDGVLSGNRSNGFGNRNPSVAAALPWVCGSMVAAALHSLKTSETTFSPTSGAHHACYSHGGGYCTFNFLVIAAIKALEAGADKVGIIDLDMHYGNGTDDIIRTLGLSHIRHYTFGGDCIDAGASAEAWLERLPEIVSGFEEVDLLIYNAGVDSHINDPLGGILTTGQMARRDRIVFEGAAKLGVPVSVSLAGGYQKGPDGSIDAVLRLHDTTFRTAGEVLETAGISLGWKARQFPCAPRMTTGQCQIDFYNSAEVESCRVTSHIL
jgi:acetoin utilization deacetylase AcuC-like enzyme